MIFQFVMMADLWLSVLVLIPCAFCISGASSYEVKINPDGQPIWFVEGRPLSLNCTVNTDGEDVKVEWMKNGFPIDANEYKIKSWTDGTRKHVMLTKAVANADDTAEFRCAAGEYGDSDQMKQTHIFSVYTRDANVTDGYDTTIKCDPDLDYKNKTVMWFKDNVPLEESKDFKDRLEVGHDNATVSIQHSKLSDSGVYKCRIEINPGLPIAQVFHENIFVYGKPYIINGTSPRNLQEVTNTSIVLKCPAGGYPTPDIFWLRGDDVLEASERIHMTALDGLNSARLEITQLNESDYGKYSCTAENSMGKEAITFTVKSPQDAMNGDPATGMQMARSSKIFVVVSSIIVVTLRYTT